MPREFGRVDRLEEAIHRILAEMLQREVADRRLAHVTVSRVRLSRDLAHATVHVTVPLEGAGAEETLRALRHAGGFLRRGVARSLTMRTVPDLRFVLDTALVDGNRLQALIEGAVAAESSPEHREEKE
jgi:ribosome-binding factor A